MMTIHSPFQSTAHPPPTSLHSLYITFLPYVLLGKGKTPRC